VIWGREKQGEEFCEGGLGAVLARAASKRVKMEMEKCMVKVLFFPL